MKAGGRLESGNGLGALAAVGVTTRTAVLAASSILALVALLVWLFSSARTVDSALHFHTVALLRETKQVDSQWELRALASSHRLVNTAAGSRDADVGQLSRALEAALGAHEGKRAASLRQHGRDLAADLQRKHALLRELQARTGELNGALRLLPAVAEELRLASAGIRRPVPELAAARLLAGALSYSNAPTSAAAGSLREELARFLATAADHEPPVRFAAMRLAGQVEQVLSQVPAIDALWGEVGRVPVAQRVDALTSALHKEHESASARAESQRQYLLAFSGALLILLAVASRRLVRNHADMRTMNRQLQQANATLEQKVRERTAELADANMIAQNSSAILYRLRATSGFPLSFISPNVARLGYGRDALLSSPDWRERLIHPADVPAFEAAMADARTEAGGKLSMELRIVDARGEIRWVENRYAAVPANGSEEPAGIEGMLFDVTDRKRQDEEVRRARDAAEAASRVKSEFLANMSHEIRTPMNAIIGFSHLLLRTELSARQSDYLHKMQAAGQHLLGIISDILDLSKIEAGKLEVECAPFDLRRVMGTCRGMLSERCGSKGLGLELRVQPGIPTLLRGDALRLQQVLLNFGNNAVKFTDTGSVRIDVERMERSGEGVCLKFSVSDTGIGIRQEELSRLFQSFSQADASTTRRFGGTGLGLAISKKLVELMGGSVGVESEFGRGSTFWFSIAFEAAGEAEPDVVRPAIQHEHAAREGVARPSGRARRILVVEDNDINQILATELLKDAGFEVDVAENGQVALGMVGAGAYDLVLMDMHMPVMDGVTATRQLRLHASAEQLPIIAMTANAMEQDRICCFQAGMNDFVSKPFDPALVLDVVHRWLPREARVPVAEESVGRTL